MSPPSYSAHKLLTAWPEAGCPADTRRVIGVTREYSERRHTSAQVGAKSATFTQQAQVLAQEPVGPSFAWPLFQMRRSLSGVILSCKSVDTPIDDSCGTMASPFPPQRWSPG
jgi:hypothetical protein